MSNKDALFAFEDEFRARVNGLTLDLQLLITGLVRRLVNAAVVAVFAPVHVIVDGAFDLANAVTTAVIGQRNPVVFDFTEFDDDVGPVTGDGAEEDDDA